VVRAIALSVGRVVLGWFLMSEKTCSVCSAAPAAFLCFCEERLLCVGCLADHLLSNPSLAHKPAPIRTPALDNLLPPHSLVLDSDRLSKAQETELAREALSKALDTLAQFRNNALMDLQQLRQQWTYEVDRVIEEFVQTISHQTRTIADQLKQKLETLEDLKAPSAHEALEAAALQLDLHLRTLDLQGVLRKGVELVIAQGAGKGWTRCLYKFFGGSEAVAVFDPRLEKVEVKLATGQRFYHNSSWCMSPASQLYVTGGSLTGRSRSDCLLYRVSSNVCLEACNMQVARRSHASIYHNRHCYVFGGLVDTEKTSLCERYSKEQNAWETLPQMKDRRSYLGCCELLGKIYIAGGSGNSAVEIFDPHTSVFDRTVLVQLAMEDSCSLLAVDQCIVLFHGSFQGQITRWTPGTGQMTTVALSFGNSWSSCAPLLCGRTLYFLRSDSIYSFDLDADETVFVKRLAKTPAHAGEVVLR